MATAQDLVGVFVGRQWQRVSAIIMFVLSSSQKQKLISNTNHPYQHLYHYNSLSLFLFLYFAWYWFQSQTNAHTCLTPLDNFACHKIQPRIVTMIRWKPSAAVVSVILISLVLKTWSMESDSGNPWTCLFVLLEAVALRVSQTLLYDYLSLVSHLLKSEWPFQSRCDDLTKLPWWISS